MVLNCIIYISSSVPGVEQGSSTVDNFHGLKPIHLPLMFQKNKGKLILPSKF